MDCASPWNADAFVEKLRPWLPLQNPLPSFVHNNVLQAFEPQGFHEGLRAAGHLYGARPYREEAFYRERRAAGRIGDAALRAALADYASGESRWALASDPGSARCEHLRVALLKAETESPGERRTFRRADYWQARHGEAFAASIQEFLIPLLASYLDQGMSPWRNPYVNSGLWNFFDEYLRVTRFFGRTWQARLKAEVAALGPVDQAVLREFERSGLLPEQWEPYALELLFDLKGWAGLVNKLEIEPQQAPVLAPACSLKDFLLMRLVTERVLNEKLALKHGLALNPPPVCSARCNLAPATSAALSALDRLRIWQEAYENDFYLERLRTLGDWFAALPPRPPAPASRPRYQLLFCLDDREGSLRRHLEEVEPGAETYGVLGFFGIDMNFVGLQHGRSVAQCPPVVTPSRKVFEVPCAGESRRHERFQRWHHGRGRWLLRSYDHTRSLARGAAASLVLGICGLGALAMRVWWPALGDLLSEFWQRHLRLPRTDLTLDRQQGTDVGYTKSEMADIVSNLLRTSGLTRDFAPVVMAVGHGASSANNPFRQAYGCGACGGNPGAPNSRAFALMANDPDVRDLLRARGLDIPADTVFAGALHDTTTDEIHHFEDVAVPAPLRAALLEAARRNALERCRGFAGFRGNTPAQALRHARRRARDLGQPRPEYGHARVALAIVGRRALTRGLSLDRRAFLVSYDPNLDEQGHLLRDLLAAAVPVCANISLDYYFSNVDNERFGCGSKLPLNVTSLLGVMTGSGSDLRIGLARQMVETHEPMRILVLVEASRGHLQAAIDGNARLGLLARHFWMRLGRIDPETRALELFTSFGWEAFENLEAMGASA